MDNRINTESATWKTIERLISKEIEYCHSNLEAPGLSQNETEYLRGRISMCRKLLNEAEPKVMVNSAFVE